MEAARPVDVIHAVNEDIPICEANVRGACLAGLNCPLHHYHTPYLWQAQISNNGNQMWSSLTAQNEKIEDVYSSPWNKECTVEVIMLQEDGAVQVEVPVLLCISFDIMLGKIFSQYTPEGSIVQMRRLSTPSYGTALLQGDQKVALKQLETLRYNTQWRWYVEESLQWKSFEKTGQRLPGSPAQAVLESKYLHGQEIYRFSMEQHSSTTAQVFLLDFRLGHIMSPGSQSQWSVRRRPLFISRNLISQNRHLRPPDIKFLPYASSIPVNWTPLDTSQEYELVPLNPDGMEYHLITSEFRKTVSLGKHICDIFRLQNPYLWNKYVSKKTHMEQKGIPTNEKQLFHGTSCDSVVQAIFHQNFDWRMSGKNATLFGRGSYFASDARYSDRYTGRPEDVNKIRWMFLARVLVGRTVMGAQDLTRPPPLDPRKPHGELYDSCVDHVARPRVFVVFDTDQCYPEYVVSYRVLGGAPQR